MEMLKSKAILEEELKNTEQRKIVLLVNVIISCNNTAKTLARTINFLEEQTCKDFEVFVVDDGSADKMLTMARDQGLERTSGKYIFFLEVDDIYHSQFVEIMTGIWRD